MSLLEARYLKKVYTAHFGGAEAVTLADIEFFVGHGKYATTMGESGSGKTTLLNILAALDKPTSGSVMLDGKDMSKTLDSRMAVYRRDNLGFVLQDFSLLDTFSIKDNTFLLMALTRKDYHEMEECLAPLAKQFEIEDLLEEFLYEVSGGWRQRVAVARALVTKPRLFLADEPTGALDSRAADRFLRIFKAVNRSGQTVFMITHSTRVASHAGRVFFTKDRTILHHLYRETRTSEEMHQKISDTLTVLAIRKRGEERDEQRA